MREELYNKISKYASFTIEDVDKLLAKANIGTLKRQENFISIGQIKNAVGYLKKGLLRSCFYDDNGNEHTTGFTEQGVFFSDLKSYQTQEPSARMIQAIEPSEIIIWNLNDIQSLRNEIPSFQVFESKYLEKVLRKKVNFQRELTIRTKKEALELLIKEYPQTAKFAPRKYIASFLGMTPYTLSRIKL
jgi:CRP-like cAMP-binding protein